MYDVCIVGAGMWGSTAARYVTTHGELDVCLIGPEEPTTSQELASRDIFSAHYDAGRIYTKIHGPDEIGHVRELLSQRSIVRFKELQKQSGVPFYKEVGYVLFGDLVSTFTRLPGIESSFNSAADVQTKFSYIDIAADSPTAVYAKRNAGYINARMYVQAQLLVARRQGCDVVNDVVNRVTETGQSDGGGRIMLIETDGGKPFRARKVLLCTGAFTTHRDLLPRELDAEVTSDITVKFEIDDACLERVRGMPCLTSEFVDTSPRECYILPPIKYPNGKTYIKIGHGRCLDKTLHTPEEVRRWYTEPADQDVVEKLKIIFHSVVKGIEPVSEEIQTCADLDTPTKIPYCDMVSPSLGVLIGGNSMGATIAEEMGRMGADMITGRENWNLDIPKELFKVRFI